MAPSRSTSSYPLHHKPHPRAPVFDQFSEEYYDRAGGKSLITTGNWHAEAVEQRELLRGRTWHPSYGVDFKRTQKLFRQANYAADSLRRWRPQRDEPQRRTPTRRRRRPSTTRGVPRVVAFDPETDVHATKGWASAATGAVSAQDAAQRLDEQDVEILAALDRPPMPLALAGAALLALAVREAPFEELTWPHFIKLVDQYGAEALVAAVRAVDAREVPDFKRRALLHFLGDEAPDFTVVEPRIAKAWFHLDAWTRSVLYAADAAAAARLGEDEIAQEKARSASRCSSRGRMPSRQGTPAGWPRSIKKELKAPPTGRSDVVLASIMRADFGPDFRPGIPSDMNHLASTTNYPTTYVADKPSSSAWLVTSLKCCSRPSGGYLVRAYHPGARVKCELHVSNEAAQRHAGKRSVKRWATKTLPKEVEMIRVANKLTMRLPEADWRPQAAAEARPFFLVRMSAFNQPLSR